MKKITSTSELHKGEFYWIHYPESGHITIVKVGRNVEYYDYWFQGDNRDVYGPIGKPTHLMLRPAND